MSMLKKSLLAVVAIFVVAPTGAFALPDPQCDQVCRQGWPSCVEECWEHLVPTTCGDAGYWCAPSAVPTGSATDAAAQRADAAPVCSEEHPAEVQPVAVES
jgi:hypothetical protein